MNTKLLGGQGEDVAEDFLCCRGYQILARNFRVRVGELDIVARKEDTIVFVEVKTRRGNRCGTPGQSVTWKKKKKIIQTARWYLRQYHMEQMCCRFDVIEVYSHSSEAWDVRQICGAFEEDA